MNWRLAIVCFFIIYLIINFIAGEVLPASVDRCAQYAQIERTQHWRYFGLRFPYWYGLGQARQESNCRSNVTAFDAGMGLTQFMPATWRGMEKHLGKLDPYNPEHSIKAQAWYMSQLQKENWDGALWLTYCFYNSGSGTMRSEHKRAGITDYNAMKAVCKRKVLILKSGEKLDLCRVGYDYPKQIFKYGQRYKIYPDEWRYW